MPNNVLIAAVKARDIEMLKHAIATAKANGQALYDALDEDGALSTSSELGWLEGTQELLAAGVDPNRVGLPIPLHAAACKGHVAIVKALLEHGADANLLDDEGWSPLRCAIHGRSTGTIKLLLAHGVEARVDEAHVGSLFEYVSSLDGDVGEIVELLRLADIDGFVPDKREDGSQGQSNQMDAGHPRERPQGRDLSQKSSVESLNRMLEAALRGQLGVVQAELERGTSVNASSEYGSTALHNAAMRGHRDVVELLLDLGADPNAVDCSGCSALSLAAMAGHRNTFDQLYPVTCGRFQRSAKREAIRNAEKGRAGWADLTPKGR